MDKGFHQVKVKLTSTVNDTSSADLEDQSTSLVAPRLYAIALRRFEAELHNASKITGVQMFCPGKFDEKWLQARSQWSRAPQLTLLVLHDGGVGSI